MMPCPRRKQPYAKRQPVAPAGNSDLLPRGPFDDGTMYRLTYVPKEISVPQQVRGEGAGWFARCTRAVHGASMLAAEISSDLIWGGED